MLAISPGARASADDDDPPAPTEPAPVLPTVDVIFEGNGPVPGALNHVFAYLAFDDDELIAPLAVLRSHAAVTMGLLEAAYNPPTGGGPSRDAVVYVAGQLESASAVPFLSNVLTLPIPDPAPANDPHEHQEGPFENELAHRFMTVSALHALAEAGVDAARVALRHVVADRAMYDGVREMAVVSLRAMGESASDLVGWAGADAHILDVRTHPTEDEVEAEAELADVLEQALMGTEPTDDHPVILEGTQ